MDILTGIWFFETLFWYKITLMKPKKINEYVTITRWEYNIARGAVVIVGLLLLIAIGMIFQKYRTSSTPQALEAAKYDQMIKEFREKIYICEYRADKIGKALDAYKKEHDNAYPTSLKELLPKYLSKEDELKCPLSEGESYVYTPPTKDSPDDFVVIRCNKHTLTFNQVKVASIVMLYKKGEVWRRTDEIAGKDELKKR